MLKTLLILGTRPEAIKMAPVVHACRKSAGIEPIVCFTGQHHEMLRQVTDYFEIQSDVDLAVMQAGQSLAQLTSKCLLGIDAAVQQFSPQVLVAQGDTTSVLAAAMVAFYRQLPFVHVEAGLRTGNLHSPWPEEFNRRMAGLTATLHAAPTQRAADCLLREGTEAANIRVVGNTVIDALLHTAGREQSSTAWQAKYPQIAGKRVVLVTTHRRENHGGGLSAVFRALKRLAQQFPDVQVMFPVHLHPEVQQTAKQILVDQPQISLLPPLAYPEFVWLMSRSYLVVSDSGGIQEESPSLRLPVLVVRDTTERMEAVDCGAVKLIGTAEDTLVEEAALLLTNSAAYRQMQVDTNPFGDGQSAPRIVSWMLERFG